jgi:hypothetical protein
MTGGLIQLVSSGKQDGYLTFNPQITFFRKIYRRHTIFGIELITNLPEQQPEYDNRVSFILNNISDLISKCYIEITIPTLSFTESTAVTNLKRNELENIQKNMNKWKSLYDNLKSYCSIEILLYQNLNNLLQSINITNQILKQNVIKFNSKYKKQKDTLTNLILDDVFLKIDLTGYMLQLTKMIVDDNYDNYNPNTEIKVSDLLAKINEFYIQMIKYLKYYYSNYVYYSNKYIELNNSNVSFAWVEYLAHFYFTNIELEIGGQVVESYSAEQAFIYQKHHIKEELVENYNQMIGQIKELNTFNNKTKNNTTLILPLNFWFCKDIGSSIPTVALTNSSVAVNLKLNKLKNLLYFIDYEKEYYDFLVVTTYLDDNIRNNLNIKTFAYDINSDLITYTCSNINYQLFALKYPSLSAVDKNDDLTRILTTYGRLVNGEYIMELSEWIRFKKYNTININIYSPYLNNNFNQYYSSVPKPSIKLITQSIYLDDLERNKFASSKLEYVVEVFQENIFDIERQIIFTAELSIDRPIKDLNWVTQPKVLLQGLCEYGKVYNSTFLFEQFFKNTYYTKQQISLNQLEIVKPKFDYAFFNSLQSFAYYNNSLPDGVYAYNFGLYPEEIQPSGTCNFSMLKGKVLNFNLNTLFLAEYFDTNFNPNQLGLQLKFMARGYNFFVVEKGMGKMIFATS